MNTRTLIAMSSAAVVLTVAILYGDSLRRKGTGNNEAVLQQLTGSSSELSRSLTTATPRARPSRKFVPKEWDSLSDREVHRRLVRTWLHVTGKSGKDKTPQVAALLRVARTQEPEVIDSISEMLGQVEVHDQKNRQSALYLLGEVAHAYAHDGNPSHREALGRIKAIAEAELAQPDTIPVGRFFSDWSQEQIDGLLHVDSTFVRQDGDLHVRTSYSKMTAVSILRRIGGQEALARLREIEADESNAYAVRARARVAIANPTR